MLLSSFIGERKLALLAILIYQIYISTNLICDTKMKVNSQIYDLQRASRILMYSLDVMRCNELRRSGKSEDSHDVSHPPRFVVSSISRRSLSSIGSLTRRASDCLTACSYVEL